MPWPSVVAEALSTRVLHRAPGDPATPVGTVTAARHPASSLTLPGHASFELDAYAILDAACAVDEPGGAMPYLASRRDALGWRIEIVAEPDPLALKETIEVFRAETERPAHVAGGQGDLLRSGRSAPPGRPAEAHAERTVQHAANRPGALDGPGSSGRTSTCVPRRTPP